MQGLLGLISLSILLVKYVREKRRGEARSWFTFCLDSSKQVFGALWAHGLNLGVSMLISNLYTTKNECEWYWVNIMVDSTFGMGVEFIVLWVLTTLVWQARLPCCRKSSSIRYMLDLLNGVYTLRPDEEHLEDSCPSSLQLHSEGSFDVKMYFLQLALWIFIVTVMKAVCLGFMWVGYTWMFLLSGWILQGVRDNPSAELLVVMIATPTVMNMFQFWMTDNFIKHEPGRLGEDIRTRSSRSEIELSMWCQLDKWMKWISPVAWGIFFNSIFWFLNLGTLGHTCTELHAPFILYEIVYMVVVYWYYFLICIRICPYALDKYAWGVPPWLSCVLTALLVVLVLLIVSRPAMSFFVGYTATLVVDVPIWLFYGLGLCSGHYTRHEDLGIRPRPDQEMVEASIFEMKRRLEWMSSPNTEEDEVSWSTDATQSDFLRAPRKLWGLLGIFMLSTNFLYLSVFQRMRMFWQDAEEKLDVIKYLDFVGILFVCKLWIAWLKGIGFMCDVNRSSPASGSFTSFFTASVIGAIAYNFFYRLVFLFVTSWQVFAMLHIFHIGGTWIEFVLPASGWYFSSIIRREYPKCIDWVLKRTSFAKQKDVEQNDWQRLMAVLMSIHVYCVFYSVLVFLYAATALCFGLNRAYWKVDLREFMLKMLVQLVTELINAGIIELWYRKRLRIRSLKWISSLLEDPQFKSMLIASGACWSICVWLIALPEDFCFYPAT